MPHQPSLAGPILCVTPSPAIDRTAKVRALVLDEPLRPVEVVVLAGGKGINAARSAHRLGAEVMTSGLAGGHAGGWLIEALEREGLRPHFATAAAETRTTYVTVDDSGQAVLVYEPPAPASPAEWAGFIALLERDLLPRSSWVIVAGAMPAGIGTGASADIVGACRRAGRPVLVDGSEAALLAAIDAGPDIVKVGRSEAVECGAAPRGSEARAAAEAIVARGARLAVVTDGRHGAAASDGRTTWAMTVPRVDAVNAVGSGDAFNAALVVALRAGLSLEAALAQGVAAGTANALALAAGMLEPALVETFARQVAVSAAPAGV